MFHESEPLFLRFSFILKKARKAFPVYLRILRNTKLVKWLKWFRKKKKIVLYFEDAARFNWVPDTNQELQEGMTRLAEQFPRLTEESYAQKGLELFGKAGLELRPEDLKMLLRKKGKDE